MGNAETDERLAVTRSRVNVDRAKYRMEGACRILPKYPVTCPDDSPERCLRFVAAAAAGRLVVPAILPRSAHTKWIYYIIRHIHEL